MQLALLGPLVVRVDGEEVAIGAAKERAVLALLALRVGKVVRPDELFDALWGERPPVRRPRRSRPTCQLCAAPCRPGP